MNEFTTVFEISAGTHGLGEDALSIVAIGAIAFLTGITGIFFPERTECLFEKKLAGPIYWTVWGVIWLLVSFLAWKIGKFDMEHLLNDYQSGQYQVAEGVVHVTHEQPFDGHSAGDKITVGGHEFEVNYFGASLGYNRTISHGGVLREGVVVRLHYDNGNYLNGVIMKVEIVIDENNQQSPSDDFQRLDERFNSSRHRLF
jgi:hypothetical protein